MAISPARFEEIKTEAKQLGALLDKSVLAAVEAGNHGILRYVVNRITRIKKCIDDKTLEKVKKGEGMAIERALRKLLLNNWDGPIVKLLDEKEQSRINKGEEMFDDFIKQYRDWVDPNTQVLAFGGDLEGRRMAANQIHYKTLRGIAKKEYEDEMGAKTYVEALLGDMSKKKKSRSK